MEKKNIYKESISVVFLILLLIIGDSIIKSNNNQEKISDKIYKSLNQIRDFHDSISSNQEKIISEIINNPNKSFLKDYNNFSSAKYLFSNDSLVYWSSDLNDPDNLYKKATSKINIYTEGNTTFLISKITQDSISLFTSTPLYYADQNKTNENKFLPTKLNGLYKINFFIENAEVEFQMDFTHKMDKTTSYITCLLLIIIMLKSLKLINIYINHQIKNKKKRCFLFFTFSVSIYILINILQNNLFVSTSSIFTDQCLKITDKIYLSLGVLTELTILIFCNIVAISSSLEVKIDRNKTAGSLSSSFILISILLVFTYFIYELISNTNVPFSFLQVYDTSIDSYIFLIIIGILSCGTIILIQRLMEVLITEKQSYVISIISFLLIGAIIEITVNQFIDLRFSILTNIIGILIYIIAIWNKKSNLRIKKFINDVGFIVLISIQLTYILYLINETYERNEMEWFANVIADESDKEFEDKIIEITEELKKDNHLINWQKENAFPSDDSILNYLNRKYFNNYELKDYNKSLTLCDTNTILIVDINELNYEIKCNNLFTEILENNPTREISDELFSVDDPTTDSYYILKLNLSPSGKNYLKYCYIEFYKEYILNHIGIPEIVTSQENILKPDLINYSFSCYEDSILQYKHGFYNYPNELSSFRHKNEEYVKTKIFKHLIHHHDNHKAIIVTLEKSRFIDIIAPFSYIFIVISIIYCINILANRKKEIIPRRQSFHGKMQLTIILTLGFSFLVAGITSFIFIKNSLENKTSEFQYEKNKTIVKNIEYDFNQKEIKKPEYLKKYKENHFTDINIYDLDGRLINTTQPKLFNGFKSRIINRDAFESIKLRNRFYYSCEEDINGIKYKSSYFPLKDKDGKICAIINIPFFDNQKESRSNITNFIVTYLNIIIALMGISALVVILMTRKTIKPLEIIQDKMQKISLGEKNEIIEWKSNDEIGDLIKIYNQLVKELEISANKLMRSERETAWREMARQVAHEIKNPLTPMKLNIQFLQMAWDEKNPDIDRKMKETTKSVLEQIEILANIATAFSDYAKLPKKNIEEFNMKDLIINTINLYDNNDNIKIKLIEEGEINYIINSDKNNLGIVFGNILKNAIQAIGKKENGEIIININNLTDKFIIKIKDNGCGIGEEEKKKIFMPNFTTKSSGMGIGLSIVYDIIETLGGSINFESEIGKGTTFIIEIKK